MWDIHGHKSKFFFSYLVVSLKGVCKWEAVCFGSSRAYCKIQNSFWAVNKIKDTRNSFLLLTRSKCLGVNWKQQSGLLLLIPPSVKRHHEPFPFHDLTSDICGTTKKSKPKHLSAHRESIQTSTKKQIFQLCDLLLLQVFRRRRKLYLVFEYVDHTILGQ